MPPPRRRVAACVLLLLLGTLSCLHVAAAARLAPAAAPAGPHRHPDGAAWRSLEHLQGARRGSRVAGLAGLKSYLARFGYMPPPSSAEHDDAFDERTEAAVKRYQSGLGLPVTGRLDRDTLDRIVTPRCGVADDAHGHAHGHSKFTFFDGEPRWSRDDPLVLTYAVSPTLARVGYLRPEDVREAFRRAFAVWARVIPVSFVETDYYDGEHDITLGFYGGRHGWDEPFDGPGGVLAHAFAPKNGGVHFDAAEHWAVDLDADASSSAVDLESVAVHEIGHVLGLRHSASHKAVMYAYIGLRERKVELTADDIEGVQLLYGSNPHFGHQPPPPGRSASPGRSSGLAGSVSLVCVAMVMLMTHL